MKRSGERGLDTPRSGHQGVRLLSVSKGSQGRIPGKDTSFPNTLVGMGTKDTTKGRLFKQ